MSIKITFPFKVKHIDGKFRVSSTPYLYDIAKENIPDHFPLHKFGYNGAVPATEETIWEESEVYSYLSSAAILTISSSDTDDTAAGDGAQKVELYGLDGSYNEITETVIMNGQTAVSTIYKFLRIFRIIVRAAGATGSNEGVIYAGTGAVASGVPANKFATVTVGHNQSLMALWTVPNEFTAFLIHLFASTGVANKTTEILAYVRPYGEVFQLKKRYHIIAGVMNREFVIPLKIPAKTDIELRGKASGGGGAISASFDLWYEK